MNRPLGDVPVNANALTLGVQLALGLIFLGSTAAFNAFVGVAVICLGASYAMPVAASLANGRRDVADAPFSLGRWGYAINTFAVLWVAFSIVLFSMPAVIPVTRVSMSEWRAVCGAWRLLPSGDVEIKRVYVEPAHRRRGLARVIMAALEDSAARAGHRAVVLNSGQEQPEALALYERLGYRPVRGYGVYACAPDAVFLGRDLGQRDRIEDEKGNTWAS